MGIMRSPASQLPLMFFILSVFSFYYNQESKVLDLLIGAASSIPGQKTQKFANWEYTAFAATEQPVENEDALCPPGKNAVRPGNYHGNRGKAPDEYCDPTCTTCGKRISCTWNTGVTAATTASTTIP